MATSGIDVHVKLENFDELAGRMRNFPDRLRKNIMRGGMRALVATLRKGVRRRIPSRTGALRRSVGISTRVLPNGQVIGKVFTGEAIKTGKLRGSDAWYGHIVERGAKAHMIEGKTKKALAFGGRVVASVQHPGFAGRYFLRDTSAQDFPRAAEQFRIYVLTKSKTFIETGR